uniref:Envelope polyprotein n=3 Tax=root TaxID=1 RepID=Q80SV3_MOUSE|nr:envelope polyprotein [Mus musculus]AAO37271.2 envelope polyprotein [Mus musculus]
MEGPAFSKPLKDKINPWGPLIVLGILVRAGVAVQSDSPHQVFNVTWRVTNLMTGQTANATSLLGTMADAFPKLYFDLCDLIGDNWDENGLGCRTPGGRKRARNFDFYVCPGHTVPTGCGGPREGYCGKWGCETTGQAYWKPSSSWDLISLKRGNTPRDQGPCYDSSAVSSRGSSVQGATPGGRCNPLVLEFTDAGKKASWDGPKVWGLRLYRSTGIDPVTRFSLTRQVLNIGPRIPIGPNPVITDQLPPSRPVQIMLPRPPQPPPTGAASMVPGTAPPSQQPGTGDRLLNLVDGAYQALNLTSPDKTQECWLCLVSGPPYYEGVAVLGPYSNHTSAPANCSVASQHKLTLSEVTGQGLCVGAVPKTHQALCNTTQKTSDGSYYLAAPAGTIWACNTGLTPCLSTTVLNLTTDYCVLVELWPKVTYHSPGYVYGQFERKTKYKREPVSLTLALLLGGLTMGGIAAGVGTGTTALVATKQFEQLQAAIHTDLGALEKSVSALEKSLTSLSEVVLQNRRGLDLLFLKEGGLCAALKEECCFYADHTGVVRDSMAKLRERLNQRQKLFESGQGWFEGLFNRSPWFTTLISTIMGPLIILLLILLFGPCILNRLVQFVKDRISVVQALVLTQQYHQLKSIDPEEVESRE